MIEDKLERDERLRLECIAQANMRAPHGASAEQVVETARRFEAFIRGEQP